VDVVGEDRAGAGAEERVASEIRSRQNIPPKESIAFAIRCDAETVALLEPMSPYFASMANAASSDWGLDAEPPAQAAHVTLDGMEVYVDLAGFIDEDAERERLQKEATRLTGQISGKQKKLGNQNFVDRAPAEVVRRERDGLAQLKEQLAVVEAALKKLGG
jgi:valyl-tRNA synthetase